MNNVGNQEAGLVPSSVSTVHSRWWGLLLPLRPPDPVLILWTSSASSLVPEGVGSLVVPAFLQMITSAASPWNPQGGDTDGTDSKSESPLHTAGSPGLKAPQLPPPILPHSEACDGEKTPGLCQGCWLYPLEHAMGLLVCLLWEPCDQKA